MVGVSWVSSSSSSRTAPELLPNCKKPSQVLFKSFASFVQVFSKPCKSWQVMSQHRFEIHTRTWRHHRFEIHARSTVSRSMSRHLPCVLALTLPLLYHGGWGRLVPRLSTPARGYTGSSSSSSYFVFFFPFFFSSSSSSFLLPQEILVLRSSRFEPLRPMARSH